MKKLIILFTLLFSNIFFSQIQIGTDIDGNTDEFMAETVVLSGDSSTIAMASPAASDGNGGLIAPVKVYKLISGNWTQVGYFVYGSNMSISISLSENGNRLVIGYPDNVGEVDVWDYQSINNWASVGATIANSGFFGFSLAISDDGATIAASDPFANNGKGYVKIYRFVSGNWVQMGSTLNGLLDGEFFGWSVSFSGNGNTLAIGMPYNTENGTDAGKVTIYNYVSGNWTQVGNSILGNASSNTGFTALLSSDGSKIAIGAPNDIQLGYGSISVYHNISNVWTQVGGTINGINNESLGVNLSFSNDGNVLVSSGLSSGLESMRVFQNVSNTWTNICNVASEGGGFVESVSISGNGRVAAYGEPSNLSNSGSAEVYDLTSVLSLTSPGDLSDFMVYPNPFKDKITIQSTQDLEIENVKVYNSLGQLVHESTEKLINLAQLSVGAYHIEVKANNNKVYKKTVLKK